VAEAAKLAVREPETFKLATAIETPIAERPAPAPALPEVPKAEPAKPKKPEIRKSQTKAAAPTAKAVVDKRERGTSPAELAEARFRRAVVLLNQGRVSEAEDQLVGALLADPGHAAARQTYVSLLLEQQRLDAAKRVLNETLSANPAQPTFALALARILAEQRDYPAALDVMDKVGSAAKNADFQALRGTVLQRMGRHQEAIEAYQAAVQGGVQPGATWVGLGISLEAAGRKAEAAQAYRRSLGGGLAREVREYAEARVRALE
jgi:MSHA biogenesis protein MshN